MVWPIVIGILSYFGTKTLDSIFRYCLDTIDIRARKRDKNIDKIEAIILEIRDLTIEYWGLTDHESKQEALGDSIIARFNYLQLIVDELFSSDPITYGSVQDSFLIFNIDCIGGDFYLSSRGATKSRRQRIETSAYELIHLIDTKRNLLKRWRD